MTPYDFDPTAYGPVIAGLLAVSRLPDLGPGTPDPAVADALRRFDPHRDLGTVVDPDAARACLAGLWLYFDYLDESHAVSQELHTPEGSFWHAVMHRREPDAFNAKYWWRRVGRHPVLDRLRAAAGDGRYTTPEAFVDECERVRGTNTPAEEAARRVQLVEWCLLFDHCYRGAVAGPTT